MKLIQEQKLQDAQNDSLRVLCFDLQPILPTPAGDVCSFYYKSKLTTYNFTIFDLQRKEGFCYIWHEVIAKGGGGNEIGNES